MKYIDPEKLIAEIEMLKEETPIGICEYDKGVENGRMEVITSLQSTIDSLQQEQPEVDFAGKQLHGEIKLREERIDEQVRSFKDLQEAYVQLVEERERMLKKSFKAHKIAYPDGTCIYRTKSLMSEDLQVAGFERGDELRLVIVKTPLAKIVEER